jgi:tetratricopeptide (TPR) repeat protein
MLSFSAEYRAAPSQGRRRRLFAVVMLLVPVIFLVALELVLRVIHYGKDLELFTTMEVGGRTYMVMNPGVGTRYFPATEFSPATSPDAFPAVKAPGTYRIFCLGGSTTVGFPYWFNAAFSTFLRTRLQALFPDRSIEVINLGLTATNSFTVLDMVRDLTEAGPDLILVYDGHNEFYGAFGVVSQESPAGARWLADLSLRLLHYRTYCLLRGLFLKIRNAVSPAPTAKEPETMMERLAHRQSIQTGSRPERETLETFRENLRATAELCAERSTTLIFGTQVSNLRSQRPFVSIPRPGLSARESTAFGASFNAGLAALEAGRPKEAQLFLREALKLDSLRGDAEFALAQALDAAGDYGSARTAYIRARDLDQLRFRATSEFNRAILAMRNPPRIDVVDMEALFAGQSPDSIVGSELIFEHLHPKARLYRVQEGVARTRHDQRPGALGAPPHEHSR